MAVNIIVNGQSIVSAGPQINPERGRSDVLENELKIRR